MTIAKFNLVQIRAYNKGLTKPVKPVFVVFQYGQTSTL